METKPLTALFFMPITDERVLRSQFDRLQREFGPTSIEVRVDRPHGMSVATVTFPHTPDGEHRYKALKRHMLRPSWERQ